MADPLSKLIRQLSKLPGVGERTATRLAFHLLRASDSYAEQLVEAIREVKRRLNPCGRCCMLTEGELCQICDDPRRDGSVVLVVASPQDVLAIERAAGFRGHYHVLHGLLSPLDGIGPDELRIKELLARLGEGSAVKELILATSPSVEGDATALYVSKLTKPLGLAVSRIASGVPIGGEIEYADSVTLQRAIEGRREL